MLKIEETHCTKLCSELITSKMRRPPNNGKIDANTTPAATLRGIKKKENKKMMDELRFEEMDTDVDREYEILEYMDEYDMTYDETESFYEVEHIDDGMSEGDEEMKTRIYNHCDLGELKELEGSYITKVGYNDCTDVVEITGVKTTTNGTMEVSFQISDGLCYVHTGEGDKNGKTNTHESN